MRKRNHGQQASQPESDEPLGTGEHGNRKCHEEGMVEMTGKFLSRGVTYPNQDRQHTPHDDWWGYPLGRVPSDGRG